MTDPTDSAADLFALPLEVFTPERDRLVKQLRADGRADEATRVAKLRKPTTDAWALNQVARRDSDLIQRLVDAHRALRQADDAGGFRHASEARNGVLEEIMAAATSVLAEGGHATTGPVRDRISRTLLAAAGDIHTEEDLQNGTLVRSADVPVEWDLGLALAPMPDPEARAAQDEAWRDEVERRQVELERLEATAAHLRLEADKARQELEAVRRRTADAEEAARTAEEEARQARKDLEAAKRSR